MPNFYIPIITSEIHKLHSPSFELYDGVHTPYPELPERIEIIKIALKNAGYHNFLRPKKFDDDVIRQLYSPAYLQFLRDKSKSIPKGSQLSPSYFITDTYAPLTSGTYQAALESVNISLSASEILHMSRASVVALTRPPGHHACSQSMGGYCYLNNVAISAQYLSSFGRVAILDIDLHHGNGTQSLFYDRRDVLYVSLHSDPNSCYPYTSGFENELGTGGGIGYNFNFPLPAKCTDKLYLQTLRKALQKIQNFSPKFLLISAGFDTYEHDPIGNFLLTKSCFARIGERISSLKLPTQIVLEGGYCISDLGDLFEKFLSGIVKF